MTDTNGTFEYDPTPPPRPEERNERFLGGGPTFEGASEADILRRATDFHAEARKEGRARNADTGGPLPGRLQNEMQYLTGNAALRASAKLSRAMRAQGRLTNAN